jgi:restriction system protein
MTIPDFQSVMKPLLEYISNGKEYTLRQAISDLAVKFNLSEEEQKELLPSGTQRIFDNRVGWARTYLGKAGLLENVRRGYFSITKKGKEALLENIDKITLNYLNNFDEFVEFRDSHKNKQEKLVVDLIISMGYGGSRKEAGKAIGKSGDEGIDGIINEDNLGLDSIYIQAKRWENPVGRPEIQKFVGALQGKRARKGIFISTSKFSKESYDYVKNIDNKVVLIDGEQLAQYMIDYNVGVSKVSSYEVKRIDTDYFEEG